MRTKNFIDQALQSLSDSLRLDISWKILKSSDKIWDNHISLKIGDKQVKVPVEIKTEIRNIHLTQLQALKEKNSDFILIADNIAKPLRQTLRDVKINFIDGQGNASINIGDTHISTEGLKRKNKPETVKTFRASHLKLIWFLLQKPEYLKKPYREIASITGLSLDTISKTLKALEKQNYYIPVRKNEFKLLNKSNLLEKWLIGFEDILKPKLKSGTYRFADKKMYNNWKNLKLDTDKILWGGEPAAAKLTKYLLPEIFTIYTNLDDSELLKNYRIVKDNEGNIEVLHMFFDPAVFHQKDFVPPLLIYADLQISGDERNMETAGKIYEEYLADTIQ